MVIKYLLFFKHKIFKNLHISNSSGHFGAREIRGTSVTGEQLEEITCYDEYMEEFCEKACLGRFAEGWTRILKCHSVCPTFDTTCIEHRMCKPTTVTRLKGIKEYFFLYSLVLMRSNLIFVIGVDINR